MRSLQEYHERNHFRGYKVPMESCWYCQRNEAVCKSKQVYPDPRTAHDKALEIARAEGWSQVIAPYWCRICDLWHLTSKPTKTRLVRREKQRRKALRVPLDAAANGRTTAPQDIRSQIQPTVTFSTEETA